MKYIYRWFILTFFIILLSKNVVAQIGQVWQCNTVESENLLLKSNNNEMSLLSIPADASISKIINVFVHVIRRTDGTGGLSNLQVNNWINLLCSDYIAHNIIIQVTGQSDINSTIFYNGITSGTYSTLINTDTHSNAIDIYLLSPNDTYSQASNIPGIALTVGGIYVGTSVLSHEFGHCLGLYHTHSGRGCNDNANCSENINGSNCSTCGDLVCDTPADPCLSGNVNTSCNYIGDTSFNPDVHNIMSYAPPTCLNRITSGQTTRIHSIISSSAIFTNRASFLTITGPSLICTSGNFTINNLPQGATLTWSSSYPGGLSINPSSGVATRQNSYSGNITVTATITTACATLTLQKIVHVGVPAGVNFTAVYNPAHGLMFSTPYEGGITPQWIIDGVAYTGFNPIVTPPQCGGSPYLVYYDFNVSLTLTNSCGTSTVYCRKYRFTCVPYVTLTHIGSCIDGGEIPCAYFIVAPNPVSETLNIISAIKPPPCEEAMIQTPDTQGKNAEYSGLAIRSVMLLDMNGQSQYKKELSTDVKNVSIDVSSLKKGIYILKISNGNYIETHRIVIN